MFTLFHHSFCPQSRFVRLALGEHGFDVRLVEERVWERREDFLALNPAGTTPVLISEGWPSIPGAGVIVEYLDEAYGADISERRLLPATMGERIEVRRLMAWFNEKFFEEASNPLVTERIYKRFMRQEQGGGGRDPCRKGKCALPSGLYRLAGADPELSGWRPADLCGPCGRSTCFGD